MSLYVNSQEKTSSPFPPPSRFIMASLLVTPSQRPFRMSCRRWPGVQESMANEYAFPGLLAFREVCRADGPGERKRRFVKAAIVRLALSTPHPLKFIDRFACSHLPKGFAQPRQEKEVFSLFPPRCGRFALRAADDRLSSRSIRTSRRNRKFDEPPSLGLRARDFVFTLYKGANEKRRKEHPTRTYLYIRIFAHVHAHTCVIRRRLAHTGESIGDRMRRSKGR